MPHAITNSNSVNGGQTHLTTNKYPSTAVSLNGSRGSSDLQQSPSSSRDGEVRGVTVMMRVGYSIEVYTGATRSDEGGDPEALSRCLRPTGTLGLKAIWQRRTGRLKVA